MAEQAPKKEALVECVVVGKKISLGQEDGTSIIAQPGDKVKVKPETLASFPNRLATLEVVEAREKADAAAAKAQEVAAKAAAKPAAEQHRQAVPQG